MTGTEDSAAEALPSARSVHNVSQTKLIAIEHPFLIRNLEKGIQSVGGSAGLSALIQPESKDARVRGCLHVSGKLIAKPSLSENVATHNLVLRITTPRRVPRKCKRNADSSEHERDESPSSWTARQHTRRLLHVMKSHPSLIKVEPVGVIDQTHRFRSMSDFASPEPNTEFVDSLQSSLFSGEYSKVRSFGETVFQGTQTDNKIVPPPIYSQLDVPFNYSYQQNAGVLTTVDERGQLKTTNARQAPKVYYQALSANFDSVPHSASSDLPPLASLDPRLQELISALQEAMKTRPILTRRCLPSLVPYKQWEEVGQNTLKLCLQYVGYSFASGPWRDTLIKFGVDPRTDARHRVYQTLMFQFDTQSRYRPYRAPTKTIGSVAPGHAHAPSHIFDGSSLSVDGSVWQMCDITDPVLKGLLATSDLRTECLTDTDGWYLNGTMAKVKTIMRWKIRQMQEGVDTLTNEQFARVATALPDYVNDYEDFYADLSQDSTAKEIELARKIRNAFRRPKAEEQPETIIDDGLDDFPLDE